MASEPLSNQEWLEIPEVTVLGVNTELETMSRSLIGVEAFPVATHGG
ncbi:MAG: hypothetical protein ACR2NT_03065 [Acidimicrobiia bacterium]